MPSPARADLYKALYVPAASVAIGAPSGDLLHVHGLAVASIEVDLGLSMAGTFRLTITDAFDAARAEFLTARGRPAFDLLKLGARIWITMGYGDLGGQAPLLSGYITGIGTSFAEGGSPDLEVSGQDSLYLLTLGNRELALEQDGVAAAVRQVARDHSLRAEVYSPAPDVEVDCNLQKDIVFLADLAAQYAERGQKWEFFARAGKLGDVLHFRPRDTDVQEVGTLKWGADLLSFRPEASLGNQVTRVEVRSWDEIGKERIVASARAGGQGGGRARTASQAQQAFLSGEVVEHLSAPVKTRQEAQERANAELGKIMNDHLKGEGETFGFPELLPDTRVRLQGLGAKFSRPYYVSKTVHSFGTSGYRTRFSIEEPDS
jgi:phage protein D